MKLYHPLWFFLALILFCFSCQQAVDVELASQNKGEKTRFCPFCQSEVSVADKKAATLDQNLGHFHQVALPFDKDKAKAILDKAKGWAEKANLAEIYIKGAEKGSIPLQVMLKLSEKDKELIGQPLTRYFSETKRDVIFNFAHVDGKNSVFCPVCKVMVSPKGHITHGQTAYDATSHSERPYDYAKGVFWAKSASSDDGLSQGGGAQWCTQCRTKALLSGGHVHGVTHFCDICKVEVYNIGHVHMVTQYCSHPKCLHNGEGVQASYGLENAGHVHGWSQYCPVCQTEMPYEEVLVKTEDQEKPLRGFVHDEIYVIRDGDDMKNLALLQAKIQEYKSRHDRWPDTLRDVEGGVPSLSGSGVSFEYSNKTGQARAIQTEPAPKVVVVRGIRATSFERGYFNTQSQENNSSSRYVKKDETNPFQLQRKVFDMVLVVRYAKQMGKKVCTTKGSVGQVVSVDSSSVTLKTPDDIEQPFSGDIVLARPKDYENMDESKIWAQVNSGRTVTIIKVFSHNTQVMSSSGEMVTRRTFHDHSFPLKKIPKVSGDSVELETQENRIIKWNYILGEVKRASDLEKSKKTDR